MTPVFADQLITTRPNKSGPSDYTPAPATYRDPQVVAVPTSGPPAAAAAAAAASAASAGRRRLVRAVGFLFAFLHTHTAREGMLNCDDGRGRGAQQHWQYAAIQRM